MSFPEFACQSQLAYLMHDSLKTYRESVSSYGEDRDFALLFESLWWNSNIIPRFTKIFEYSKNFQVIVIGIRNDAFTRNLSPWDFSRAEKLHRTFRNLRLGQVPFKIIFFEYCWYHRDERSKKQVFTQDHEKRVTNSSVFRALQFSFFENQKP